MAKILIVEDDQTCSGVIQDLLSHQGHSVEVVGCGQEGRDRLMLYDYDLAVLDWQLPKLTGIQICRDVRAAGSKILILMLTGKSDIPDKEHGFDAGADDYLTKPFDGRELLLRVRALLRRPGTLVSEQFSMGDVSLDTVSRRLTRGNEEIELLPKEYALLEFLMKHPDHVYSHDSLLNQVWPSESDASPDAIRKCVERIRKKLDQPGKPSFIETVHRVGYVLRSQQ